MTPVVVEPHPSLHSQAHESTERSSDKADEIAEEGDGWKKRKDASGEHLPGFTFKREEKGRCHWDGQILTLSEEKGQGDAGAHTAEPNGPMGERVRFQMFRISAMRKKEDFFFPAFSTLSPTSGRKKGIVWRKRKDSPK